MPNAQEKFMYIKVVCSSIDLTYNDFVMFCYTRGRCACLKISARWESSYQINHRPVGTKTNCEKMNINLQTRDDD